MARSVPRWIALASIVSACSGTLPGLGPEPPAGPVRQSAPGVTTRTVLEEGVAPRAVRQPPPQQAAVGIGAAPVPPSEVPYSPAPAPSSRSPQTSPWPPSMTPNDVRDRQIDMLTEAVTALRQEVAKSYEHSQRLTQENEKLRAVVSSLRRELNKGKSANKVLRDHLKALEKRMRELRPPPLEPSDGGEAAAEPKEEAPAEAVPEAPEQGAQQAGPSSPDGGFDTGPPASED